MLENKVGEAHKKAQSTVQRKPSPGTAFLTSNRAVLLSTALFPGLMRQVLFREEKSCYNHFAKQFEVCISCDQQFCS